LEPRASIEQGDLLHVGAHAVANLGDAAGIADAALIDLLQRSVRQAHALQALPADKAQCQDRDREDDREASRDARPCCLEPLNRSRSYQFAVPQSHSRGVARAQACVSRLGRRDLLPCRSEADRDVLDNLAVFDDRGDVGADPVEIACLGAVLDHAFPRMSGLDGRP
jgi:hypothetical protein